MFGLSITKLLLLALVVFLAWRGLRMVQALSERGADRLARERTKKPPAAGGPLDLQPCPRCGTYVARGRPCQACEGAA